MGSFQAGKIAASRQPTQETPTSASSLSLCAITLVCTMVGTVCVPQCRACAWASVLHFRLVWARVFLLLSVAMYTTLAVGFKCGACYPVRKVMRPDKRMGGG